MLAGHDRHTCRPDGSLGSGRESPPMRSRHLFLLEKLALWRGSIGCAYREQRRSEVLKPVQSGYVLRREIGGRGQKKAGTHEMGSGLVVPIPV